MLSVYLSLLETEEERDQFEILYRSYHGLMLTVAQEVLGDFSLAEDAVHDAFLKLMGCMDKITDAESSATKAFLAIVTKNTARNLLRKDRSREEAELRLGLISLRGGIPQEVSVERILAAIEKLPETQRDVLHLKVRSELSDGEIASLLGIQGNTYRKRLQRGRENLLLTIQGEEAGKC